MGFNYLQTDDRDDYFAQFESKKTKRRPVSFSLVDVNGKIILKEVPSFKIRLYAKQTYLKPGQSGKKIWRRLLESKSYKVINNY